MWCYFFFSILTLNQSDGVFKWPGEGGGEGGLNYGPDKAGYRALYSKQNQH